MASAGISEPRGSFGANLVGLQLVEARNEGVVLACALARFGFNGLENIAQPVEQLKKRIDYCAVGGQLAVAQQAEQVFAGVSQLLKSLEAQKARGSLNGVHGAKNFRQQCGILRTFFEIREAPFHAVQPFLALNQELPR